MNFMKRFRREEAVVALPPPASEGKRLADERRTLEAALKANEAATVRHFDKCWEEVGQ